MKLPLLASFIILLAVISHLIRKHNRIMEAEQQSFWSKERAANNVRKKPLDDLNYITIPFEKLPCDTYVTEPKIADILDSLHVLSERKIVNLTGITNTDLKLTYGTANITALTEYDQNFTSLVTTLQKWAETLYDLGAVTEAKTILEYAVSVESDVSGTYEMLASMYKATGDRGALDALIEKAENLTSPSGKIIVRKLGNDTFFHVNTTFFYVHIPLLYFMLKLGRIWVLVSDRLS